MQTILHAGCGNSPLPKWLGGKEVRLDIDPEVNPDIVASLTDLGEIGLFDMIWCSHTIEHLYPKELRIALKEFHRVLRPGGVLIALVPDLEDVRPTEEIVYESSAGPVSGIDMFYGYRPWVETNPYMAHHNGFVSETLTKALLQAGFAGAKTSKVEVYNLMGVAVK